MYRPFLQNNRLLWAFLLALGLGVGVQAQSLVNAAHVVDSAGGASESASYSNTSAIGQPFGFDENSSATYVNQGGFLNGGSGGVTLWGDDLDSADSTGWIVNKSTDDTAVTFGYDYSADGIPAAPNSDGTTIGVKFEANITAPTGAEAISISPVGGNFTGDYQLNFDMWINANGPFPGGGGGSTEFFTAGVGTTGDHLQWASDNADGAWFGVSGDGGSGNSGDFRAFIGGARQAAESGAYEAGTTADSRNNTNAYYAEAFPGQSPPAAQAAAFPGKQTGALANGAVGFAWRQVSITKIGDSVAWAIDGVTIATLEQSLEPFTTEGNIFVGYYDPFSSVSDNRATSFGLVDNLVVQDLRAGDVETLDTDSDGLTDLDETNIHKTDPNNPDTDGDGVNDGDEVAAETNPLKKNTLLGRLYGNLELEELLNPRQRLVRTKHCMLDHTTGICMQ